MTRVNVKIGIPVHSPDKFLKLCDRTVGRNTELGVDTPIHDVNMVVFAGKVEDAKTLKSDARKLHEKRQAKNGEGSKKLGIGKGDSSRTEGTVLYFITDIRDVLLRKNRQNPQNLELWGYEVVVSEKNGKVTVRVELYRQNPDKM